MRTMIVVDCPWCQGEVSVASRDATVLRCEDCAVTVDVTDAPVAPQVHVAVAA